MSPVPNPALYRRMSEPHASRQAASEAVAAFFEDLQVIREKHRIRDVVVTTQVAYLVDRDEAVAQSVYTIGQTVEALHMAAHTLGILRAEQAAVLDKLATKQRGTS